jgi:hypothetical protein
MWLFINIIIIFIIILYYMFRPILAIIRYTQTQKILGLDEELII